MFELIICPDCKNEFTIDSWEDVMCPLCGYEDEGNDNWQEGIDYMAYLIRKGVSQDVIDVIDAIKKKA